MMNELNVLQPSISIFNCLGPGPCQPDIRMLTPSTKILEGEAAWVSKFLHLGVNPLSPPPSVSCACLFDVCSCPPIPALVFALSLGMEVHEEGGNYTERS